MTAPDFPPEVIEKAARALLDARRLRWDNVHQGECITDARAVLAAVADDLRAEGARQVFAAMRSEYGSVVQMHRAAREAVARIEKGARA